MKRNISKNLFKILAIAFMFSIVMSNLLIVTSNYSLAEVKNIAGVDVNPEKDVNVDGITEVSNQVIGIIQVVGVLIAVGVIMVLGIKYMMGSAEEKAEYKKVFIPYLIGAILLFAASMLAESIYNLASNIK